MLGTVTCRGHATRSILFATQSPHEVQPVDVHFAHRGFDCRFARDSSGFEDEVRANGISLAVIDLNFLGTSTIQFYRNQRRLLGKVPVVFIHTMSCEQPSIDRIIEAMKAGSRDVILPPWSLETLDRLVEMASDSPPAASVDPEEKSHPVRTPSVNDARPQWVAEADQSSDALLTQLLIGTSSGIREVRRLIADVADTRATVLIHGESGTGKELVASAIHQLSKRSKAPYVPVNMAAIPQGLAESLLFGHAKGSFTGATVASEGCFIAADGGTLFLDEIGELELQVQPKLLRFLQQGTVKPVGSQIERKLDVRIVAAMNRDPRTIVQEGVMREDLFFRLHVVPIRMPPLRDRREDIAPLAELFLRLAAESHERTVEGFSPEVIQFFQQYEWPGNVRQLENLVERLVIFAREPRIGLDEIPADLQAMSIFPDVRTSPRDRNCRGAANPVAEPERVSKPTAEQPANMTPFERYERTVILDALQRVGGHVVDAANLLGLGQATMYRKIKRYSIPHERKRRKTVPK